MRAKTILLSTAIFGIVLAALVRLADGPGAEPIARLLTLGMLGVVPLALLVQPSAGPTFDRLRALAAFAVPVCGGLAVVGLWLPAGEAGLWIAPWMGSSLLVASMGVAALFTDRGFVRPARFVSGSALCMLPVGAGWLVLSRMGARPMGFDAIIVALTAVHFHFMAVAAPTWSARVIEALDGGWRRAAGACGVGLIVSVPIVAAGLTVSPWLAMVGTALLCACLLGLAVVALVRVRPTLERRASRVLLAISALSLLLSMPLAVYYQWGQATHGATIDLEWMIRLHGFANAHGFATCGLLAWAIEDRADQSTESENGPSD